MTEQEAMSTTVEEYRRIAREYKSSKEQNVTLATGAVFRIKKISAFRLVSILADSQKDLGSKLSKYQAEKMGVDPSEDADLVNDIAKNLKDDKPDSFVNQVLCAGVISPRVTISPSPDSLCVSELEEDDKDRLFLAIAKWNDITDQKKTTNSKQTNGSQSE
jgi:hypothetical protein